MRLWQKLEILQDTPETALPRLKEYNMDNSTLLKRTWVIIKIHTEEQKGKGKREREKKKHWEHNYNTGQMSGS